MFKLFCDGCGEEISNTANGTVFEHQFFHDTQNKTSTKVAVRVTVAINGSWNGGHICMRCTQEVINDGVPNKRVTRGGNNDGDLQLGSADDGVSDSAVDRLGSERHLDKPSGLSEGLQSLFVDPHSQGVVLTSQDLHSTGGSDSRG